MCVINRLIFLVIKWMTLCDRSPVLRHYSEVADVLRLIKAELTGVPPSAPTPSPSPPSPPPLPPSPEPEPRPPPTNSKGSSGGLSGGQKAGVVFGVLIGVGLIGFGGFVYKKRRANIRRSRYGAAARRSFL
ncbi:hypothetical protein DVH24_023272 [Malus domestica]|uniref:Uncharacterized protein n=1 Tax=Malus domestica TaxID=3750 RepID=A0A498KMY0_MALDO|nr:hypothetical protein DVH24_023272 [Malus domestica]